MLRSAESTTTTENVHQELLTNVTRLTESPRLLGDLDVSLRKLTKRDYPVSLSTTKATSLRSVERSEEFQNHQEDVTKETNPL